MTTTKEITAKLQKTLAIKNRLAVPRVVKVTLNVGFGANKDNETLIKSITQSLIDISGQKPILTKAKKSIAGFKIHQGQIIGAKVTLRRRKMVDFLTKLANVTLPSIRDFKGLKMSGFDRTGNYTLGFKELLSFPEVTFESPAAVWGVETTITTNAKNPVLGRQLLEAWGFPFENKK